MATISGSSGNDILTGTASNDTIFGGSGNDQLYGSDGDDFLFGEEGADSFYAGTGNNYIDGGATYGLNDVDFLYYTEAIGPVFVDLSLGLASHDGWFDRIIDIEGIIGSVGNDTLIGDSQGNNLNGNLGSNYIDGGAGSDIVRFIDLDTSVFADLSTGRATHGNDTDTLIGIEHISGSRFDDTLIGDDGDNTLLGAGGNNSLSGGDGNDRFRPGVGNNTIDGGAGDDILGYIDVPSSHSLYVDLAAGVSRNLTAGTADYITSIEHVNILNADTSSNTIIGNDADNVFQTGGGSDYLYGGGGDDRLYADRILTPNRTVYDVAADTIDGGAGCDTTYYEMSADYSVVRNSANQATVTHIATGIVDILYNIEMLQFRDLTIDWTHQTGTAGNDTLTGTTCDDTLFGLDGDDYLNAGSGDDYLSGGSGDDQLIANTGNNTLDGGDGYDIAGYGDLGTENLYVDLLNGFTLHLGTGTQDVLIGIEEGRTAQGNDTLLGSDGDNRLLGREGNDYLNGRGGDDRLVADRENTFVASADTVDGGAGCDSAFYYGPRADYDVVRNSNGEIVLTHIATGIVDILYNVEMLEFSDQTIDWTHQTGTAGNDTLDGTSCDDTLLGLDGDDFLTGNEGSNYLDGGDGSDTVSFGSLGATPVFVDLGAGRATHGNDTDTLIGIEHANGTIGNDTLRGSDDNNVLNGGPGDDYLSGGDGDDRLIAFTGNNTLDGGNGYDIAGYGDIGTENLYVDLLNGFTLHLGAGTQDVLVSIEEGRTAQGNDTLFGSDGDNQLWGREGNDYLNGRGGDDRLVADNQNFYNTDADTIDGGDGCDIAVYYGPSTDYVVERNSDNQIVLTHIATGIADILYNVEILQFSDQTIDIGGLSQVGTDSDDTLEGAICSDTLSGLGGNDLLIGDGRGDVLNGGSGIDTASYTGSATGVVVDLQTGRGTGGDADGDTLIGIENLVGSDHDDSLAGGLDNNSLYGGLGDDTLFGNYGSDTMNGGDGFDWISYEGAPVGFTIDLSRGNLYNSDYFINVEGIIGTDHADILIGDANNNGFVAGLGSDNLTGGVGDDLFIYRNVADLNGDVITDLYGGDVVDLTGLGSINYIGAGAFTRVAGQVRFQNSVLEVDSNGDGVSDAALTLQDVVILAEVAPGRFQAIEPPGRIRGTPGNDTLIGGDEDNFIFGYSGNDRLEGHGGSDTLVGGPGADTLDGGDGFDWISYADADRGYNHDLNTGRLYEERFSNFEGIIAGAFNDTLTGNAADNGFIGGMGSDTLTGGLGSDRFIFQHETGNDVITDFQVGLGGDRIELSNYGIDDFATLQSHFTQQGADLLITFDAARTILLQNVLAGNLGAENFVFG